MTPLQEIDEAVNEAVREEQAALAALIEEYDGADTAGEVALLASVAAAIRERSRRMSR
jgi:hypothetical protein